MCPVYLAYGMTLEQYWDGDVEYAAYYRDAHEMRREMENEAAWMQGMYFAEAVASSLYGRKHKYPAEPYPLKTKISKEREKRRQEQNERKTVDYMMTFMNNFNKRFAENQKAQAPKD